MPDRILKWLVIISGLGYLVVTWFIPFTFSLDDAGRYYALAHFLFTGESVRETWFPSFTVPSQFYPLFGYPFILYTAKIAGGLSGINWLWLLKTLQSAAFLGSAGLLYSVTKLLVTRRVALWAALIFFGYISFFHYSNVVMSECIALFLVLLTLWLYVSGSRTMNFRWLAWSFLVLSVSCLYKPVLLASFPVLLWIQLYPGGRKKLHGLWLTLIFIFPFFLHSAADQLLLGKWSVRTGTGWNLWNRVIHTDGSIPRYSSAWAKYDSLLRLTGEGIPRKEWWHFTARLSSLGYDEKQSQDICLELAWDGLKENKLRYFTNTFAIVWKNLTWQEFPVSVFKDYDDYFRNTEGYAIEERNRPLVKELLTMEEYYRNCNFCDFALRNYFRIVSWHKRLTYPWINYFLIVLWLFWGTRMARGRKTYGRYMFLTGITSFLFVIIIIFGSAMMEVPQSRYGLPAYPLIIAGAAAAIDSFLQFMSGGRKTR